VVIIAAARVVIQPGAEHAHPRLRHALLLGELPVGLCLVGGYTFGCAHALAQNLNVLGIGVDIDGKRFFNDFRFSAMRFARQTMKPLQQIFFYSDHVHGVSPFRAIERVRLRLNVF
jgi:hypothetical protein